jgi:protein-tyrosine phosphatase
VIDLHCHLLPGIDDGPPDPAQSLELARELEADGILTVACTPHVREDFPSVDPSEFEPRCGVLRDVLEGSGVGLSIVEGGEVSLVWALGASPEELRLASYGQRGTDLLIETPYGPLPSTFEEWLFRVAVQGYRVLLAHPERNPSFHEEPQRLAEIVRRGALLQVTAAALVRPRRSRSGGLARDLMKEGLAHVIATDAHGPAGPERELLSNGVEAGRGVVGSRADWMVVDAPQAILAGEPLPVPPPVDAGRPKGLLRRLRS